MNRAGILAVVQANVRAIIEGARGREIRETDSMRDYGADSLEIIEVVSRSMRQLRIQVPRGQLVSAQCLGDLVSLLEKAANPTRIAA